MTEFIYTSAPVGTIDDINFIKALVAHAHASGEPWAVSWTAKAVDSELSSAAAWIATDNFNRRLGFAFVRPPGNAWELTLVAVDPEVRGAGVFHSLLASIRQRIAETAGAAGGGASSTAIDLEVRADNRSAIRAYEKNGFEKIGLRVGYYADGVDAFLYRLK